jgi:SAM-dependent methyltransferase
VLDMTSADATLELLPAYLRDVYSWAYLTPWLAGWLDRQLVVQTILWGNAQRLINDVLTETKSDDHVFQPAAVYGDFSRQVAQKIGLAGRLEVRDVAPLQVDLTRRKLADLPQARVSRGDAVDPDMERADVVACFFLLHEVPDDVKVRITRSMLQLVVPGGKAVFVDYHRPHRLHPLKPLMRRIFDWLEPFAPTMWSREISDLAGSAGRGFCWRKRTRFGGMYQVVVAERRTLEEADLVSSSKAARDSG